MRVHYQALLEQQRKGYLIEEKLWKSPSNANLQDTILEHLSSSYNCREHGATQEHI